MDVSNGRWWNDICVLFAGAVKSVNVSVFQVKAVVDFSVAVGLSLFIRLVHKMAESGC